MISSSSRRCREFIGTALLVVALASSLIARAFEFEQPAARNSELLISANFFACKVPPERFSTRWIIVAAALVESC